MLEVKVATKTLPPDAKEICSRTAPSNSSNAQPVLPPVMDGYQSSASGAFTTGGFTVTAKLVVVGHKVIS